MATEPIVSLELGTSTTRALVGEVREDGQLMVTGVGLCPTRGVRKGEVVDFDHALACLKSALLQAEEQADIAIEVVHLVIGGASIASEVNRGTVHVLNEDREITERELRDVADAARLVNLPREREVLHSIAQNYRVDDHENIVNPLGMEGHQLSQDMLIIHGVGTLLHNRIRVARSLPADVEDVAFAGLCAALAVLTPEQKSGGVAVADLGGGVTSYVVYADQRLALAGALGVGGDHVTNDLALGLLVPTAQAERLKLEHGSALNRPAARAQTIHLPAEGGFAGRAIRLSDVHLIAHARMDELFSLLYREFEQHGLIQQLGAGLVLTGGGALLADACELAERKFNMPCAVGRPRQVSGIASVTGGCEHAAAVGMLHYAQRAGRPARGGRLKNLLKGIFRT